MGKRGTKPEPTNLKRIKGVRPDRINDAEPVPPADGVPNAPSYLDRRAKAIWRKLAPQLHRQGVLTSWDDKAFAAWCDSAARVEVTSKAVQAEGTVSENKMGRTVSPEFKAWKDAVLTMLRIGSEFGLTPSSRSTIKIEPAPDLDDEIKRMLAG